MPDACRACRKRAEPSLPLSCRGGGGTWMAVPIQSRTQAHSYTHRLTFTHSHTHTRTQNAEGETLVSIGTQDDRLCGPRRCQLHHGGDLGRRPQAPDAFQRARSTPSGTGGGGGDTLLAEEHAASPVS